MEAYEDFTEDRDSEYPADTDAEDDSAKRVEDFISAAVHENALMKMNYFGE